MAELLKKNREFVVPGDKIMDSMDYLPGRNCFRDGDSIIAKKIGLLNLDNRVISIIPLNGVYIPKAGDMVIGEVEDIQSNGWVIDINSLSSAFLPLSGVREYIASRTDLSRFYSIGDVIYAKVSSAQNDSIHLTMQDMKCRKFKTGRIVKINPAKVPRLIGKKGSMINLIKDKTECKMSAGQNGFVWLEGKNEALAISTIKVVEAEAQIDGLTDKISALLAKEIKNEKGK